MAHTGREAMAAMLEPLGSMLDHTELLELFLRENCCAAQWGRVHANGGIRKETRRNECHGNN